MINPVLNHERIALQFSGGKDSLACLYLLRPYWDRILVMWGNSGDAFPEIIEQMERIKEMVPRFLEVRGNQPAVIAEFGLPADIFSVWDTVLGHSIQKRTTLFQSPLDCCARNLFAPMNNAVNELGITLVIRGQRNEEMRTGPIRSGHVENGVEYWFPLQDWTRQDVVEFLRSNGVELPGYYRYVDSSLDCVHCAAYMDEIGKLDYLRERHPQAHAEVRLRIDAIISAAQRQLDILMDLHRGVDLEKAA